MDKLTTSNKALEIILNNSQNYGTEEVPFFHSLGRVLKENIVADRDFPPFNRVSMDGIAIQFSEFENGKRTFNVEGIQPAGSKQLSMQNHENCIEVMTGAVLPKNTDVVIPYEQVSIVQGIATIEIKELRYFQNIHVRGKDKKEGDLIIAQNKVISSAEIGVLATVGKWTVKVAKQPKVMIVSTGDELVEVNETPANYQIRRSNVHTLVSILKKYYIDADSAHIADDKNALKEKIENFLNDYDVLLFSGAVSKGKFDFIPEILEGLRVEKLFHKVAQRPGKPFWFGHKIIKSSRNDRNDKIVFAFPGNPISTFVSCLKYFVPWYQKSMKLDFENRTFALLGEDVIFKPSLTYFLQVKLEKRNGDLVAVPIRGNGSGDLANLVEADAFIELPNDRVEFKKDEVFPIIEYR